MDDMINECEYNNYQVLAFKDIKEINSAWRAVLFLAQHKKYAPKEFVQPGNGLMFLDKGRICMIQQSLDGDEKILWYIREGCLFGEAAFFDPILIDYYCICTTACSIYVFSENDLERISKEHPDLMLNLLHTLARKMRILACQASSLSQDSLLVRICKFLSQRIVPGSSPLLAKVGMSQQEMANMLGVHRVSLYRELRQQEKQGLFGTIKGNAVTILRPYDFYRLAGITANLIV